MLNAEQMIELLNRCLQMNLDTKNTPVDVKFSTLGIDSMDFFNILMELESVTGKKIPDSDVDNLTTIKELVDYFA